MEEEHKQANRQQTQQTSKNKWWCDKCDRTIVGNYGHCPVCRAKSEGKVKG